MFSPTLPLRGSLRAAIFVLVASSSLRAAETAVTLENPGFEQGLAGWRLQGDQDQGMTSVVAEAARTGSGGARIDDQSADGGSSLFSETLPAAPGKTYTVRFWGRTINGNGLGVYLQFLDSTGQLLNTKEAENEVIKVVPADAMDWTEFTLSAQAPPEADKVRLWVHSFMGARVVVDVDDFSLTELGE